VTDHIIVCPYNEELLDKLKERVIVISIDDPGIIQSIHKEANKSLKLNAIKVQTENPLSSVAFQEDWINLPLAVYSPEFGKYKDILRKLNLIRKLNIRIYLSSHYDDNFTGLKILSSLNISCGLYFNEEPPSWDALNDLMHYAIYSNTKHAPIEPFDWLASHYEPTGYTDYSSVYFNDPTKYLHINEKEQIALNEKDLLNDEFIDEGIQSLDRICDNKKYNDSINSRYDVMLQMSECAFCPVFRICLAKFSNIAGKKDTCKAFFSDFMDAADYAYIKRKNGTQTWQL